MRPADIDWRVLRGALIAFTLSTLISATLVGTSYYFRQDVKKAYDLQTRSLAGARSRYLTLDEEKRLIEMYLPRYRALEAEGIIGVERRLNWLETLREAVQRIKLPSLRYDIASQGRYTPEFPVDLGGFQLYASDMMLDLGLLHEGDLSSLLTELEQNGKGLFSAADCTVRRMHEDFGRDPTRANVSAQCSLRWLTIRLSRSSV